MPIINIEVPQRLYLEDDHDVNCTIDPADDVYVAPITGDNVNPSTTPLTYNESTKSYQDASFERTMGVFPVQHHFKVKHTNTAEDTFVSANVSVSVYQTLYDSENMPLEQLYESNQTNVATIGEETVQVF